MGVLARSSDKSRSGVIKSVLKPHVNISRGLIALASVLHRAASGHQREDHPFVLPRQCVPNF
jgi:hypothetical protein